MFGASTRRAENVPASVCSVHCNTGGRVLQINCDQSHLVGSGWLTNWTLPECQTFPPSQEQVHTEIYGRDN